MSKKMNYENFLYLLTYIISINTHIDAILATDKQENHEIVLNGNTKTCKVNITLNETTLRYWYDNYYGCIETAEEEHDSKYKFFWNYAIKPYLCNEFVPLLGTEFFIND